MKIVKRVWPSEKKYILDLQEIPEEFRDIAEYLEKPVFSEDFRRQLEAEEEIDTIFDRQEAQYLAQIEEARQEAEEAKVREEEAKFKLAKKMLKYGESIEEIMKETGLNREDVERLK